jgi:hypothetical protein
MAVKWRVIEPLRGVAKGEASGTGEQKSAGRERHPGSKRPSSARPAAPPKSKYAMLYPPPKTQLRPQSVRTLKSTPTSAETTPAMLLPAHPPPPTIDEVKSNIVLIASAEEEDHGVDQDGLGTFLTQARPMDNCRVSILRCECLTQTVAMWVS